MSDGNKRVSYRVKREKRNSIPPSNQLLCWDELILLSSVVELKDVYQWVLNQDANNLIHLLWLALLTVYAKLLKTLITTVVNYQLWVQLQMETSVQFIILITNVFSNHLVESLIIIIVITVSVFFANYSSGWLNNTFLFGELIQYSTDCNRFHCPIYRHNCELLTCMDVNFNEIFEALVFQQSYIQYLLKSQSI